MASGQRRDLDLKKIGQQAQRDSELFRERQRAINDAELSTKPSVSWKLKLEPVSYIDHDVESTTMELRISGKVGDKPTTAMFANMIRHIIMSRVPVYGIGYGSIKFTALESVFDHHYMARRLCSVPVPGVVPEILILPEANHPYVKGDCGTMAPIGEYKRHPGDTKEIRMVLNVHNTDEELRHVTTNDLVCYINDERVELYNKARPQLIVDLRRNERISVQLTPQLGYGDMHNGWCPVEACFVKGTAGNHPLVLSSYGQMSERELIIRGCRLLKLKMRSFIQQLLPIMSAYDGSSVVDLPFKKEGPELAIIIRYILAQDPRVSFQSAVKKHEQIPEFLLHVKTVNGVNPVGAVLAALATIRDIYGDLEKQAEKLPEKPQERIAVLKEIDRLISEARRGK